MGQDFITSNVAGLSRIYKGRQEKVRSDNKGRDVHEGQAGVVKERFLMGFAKGQPNKFQCQEVFSDILVQSPWYTQNLQHFVNPFLLHHTNSLLFLASLATKSSFKARPIHTSSVKPCLVTQTNNNFFCSPNSDASLFN